MDRPLIHAMFRFGASSLAVSRMRRAKIAAPTAGAQLWVATRPVVPAQAKDEKPSAKVASLDEVWRRRKWLRLACARNQSWMRIDDSAATATPATVTGA